jgi:D-inositol-3-phosphate glycosyltransferase
MNTTQFQQEFIKSRREHALLLTIHGIHEWSVVPGYQDTGGQNLFVNQLSAALEKNGYKITIVNRGGYPHPRQAERLTGLRYKTSFQRILYLEDGFCHFVRKEDMGDHLTDLVKTLADHLSNEGLPIDLVISHYWDAGMVACLLKRELGMNTKHVWVPHSLGTVKKRNVPSQDWESLRIKERIKYEGRVFGEIDFLAATSNTIEDVSRSDYGYPGRILWLPPCVDRNRFHPRWVNKDDAVWSLLSGLTNLTPEEIQHRKVITEISRTDSTKQKDVLIKSFARILPAHPDSLLIVSIDENNTPLAQELMALLVACKVQGATAAVGSIWNELPAIYAISDIYCTPSIMEGFGMSVQEAAATKVPVISSDLVPFATEYLTGGVDERITGPSGTQIRRGKGALIVSPGDIAGFALAMDLLLSDEALRKEMGRNAYRATIPYFTWDHIVKDFLTELKR